MRKIIRAIALLSTVTVCLPTPAFPWGAGGGGCPTVIVGPVPVGGFTQPFVLTYPSNTAPVDRPRPSLDPSIEQSLNKHAAAGSTSRRSRRHPSQ
jgi:hypothetical protein